MNFKIMARGRQVDIMLGGILAVGVVLGAIYASAQGSVDDQMLKRDSAQKVAPGGDVSWKVKPSGDVSWKVKSAGDVSWKVSPSDGARQVTPNATVRVAPGEVLKSGAAGPAPGKAASGVMQKN